MEEHRKKRILLVTHTMNYGGQGKMFTYLANAIDEAGYDTYVYSQESTTHFYPLNSSITYIPEKTQFKNYYTRRFKQIKQMRDLIDRVSPNLVIAFITNQSALAVLGTRHNRIPVIMSCRGDPYEYTNIVEKMKIFVINHAEGGVFQSREAMRCYGKKLQKKSRVIMNPCIVPEVRRIPWKERDNEIAFVGRFQIVHKRQDLMLEAFSIIHKTLRDFKLVLYGDGNDRGEICDLIKKYKLENSVVMKGVVNNIPQAISRSKLFVLASDFEGLPNALIEAMAVGLPVISTDWSPGAVHELINNGENGVIIPCNNSDILAQSAIEILSNPQKADKMGKTAEKIRLQLSPDIIYKQWINYIEEVIGRNEH